MDGLVMGIDSQANAEIVKRITEAREKGAMYHPTNPEDAYFCSNCCTFGRGDTVCWLCESSDVLWQWVPRWGGGSQSMQWDESVETSLTDGSMPVVGAPVIC